MKIRTKNQKFTGRRAGIDFVNGVGELRDDDERVAAQLERLGYTVENDGEGGEVPAGNASRDDWAAYAVSLGFDVLDEWKRDDIKALIQGDQPQG